jgi:hypothetical protein
MKFHFTAEELHSKEYAEFVKCMSESWRLNDERNKRIDNETLASKNIRKGYTEEHKTKKDNS